MKQFNKKIFYKSNIKNKLNKLKIKIIYSNKKLKNRNFFFKSIKNKMILNY